ncbi:hypothetical protein N7466_001508 [Penicillium verhagenii]|uniref:uncharacterized protein n=1 Tax=Penicillium verhagenii TaxID=1562060 RepID=UPI0025459DBF|nr:uncharacterized protein N7466_001508 [Penicillium verhagenii]KAJ5938374.1 hypothetical protein N7466_001508 [Penicillium verhagenii]
MLPEGSPVTEDAQELSGSLPSIPKSSIPFPAQHVILQALQRHLEGHIFQFVQKWLLAESHAIGWTCAEAVELHKIFGFLTDYNQKLEAQPCSPPAHSIQRWNRVVSSIRHASVHRILKAPDALLRMVRYAIGFLESIAGVRSSRSLRRLHRFLKTMITSSDRLAAQLRDKVNMQILLCNAHPEQLGRRLQLLPEALRRVLQNNEQSMVSQIQGFLQLEFA